MGFILADLVDQTIEQSDSLLVLFVGMGDMQYSRQWLPESRYLFGGYHSLLLPFAFIILGMS